MSRATIRATIRATNRRANPSHRRRGSTASRGGSGEPNGWTATAVLRDRGGLADVEAELQQVDRDARALAELAERANALAARADAVDAPVGALERLA